MYNIEKSVYDNLIKYFKSNKDINGVILLGSRTKGNDKINSDIDLCIDCSHRLRGTISEEINDIVGIHYCDIVFQGSVNEELRREIGKYGVKIY